uniref:Uncharacterized protein n=1 Tax=Mucochytrium quahogii TaxID=96639 RepID=A0A7S2SNS2_9STRA|mmetsp:Transcript_9191/g.19921  ORF Transcript_9191/g.19921 Transcript_9191/m.19921 type:complete len:1327 (+) Transcript_9191:86-4066(+)
MNAFSFRMWSEQTENKLQIFPINRKGRPLDLIKARMNSLGLCIWAFFAVQTIVVRGLQVPEVVELAFRRKLNYINVSSQVEHYCGARLRSDADLFPSIKSRFPSGSPHEYNRTSRANESSIVPVIFFDSACTRIRAQVASMEEPMRKRVLERLLSKYKRSLDSYLHGGDEMTYALLRLRETVSHASSINLNLTLSAFDRQYFFEPVIATLGRIYVYAMEDLMPSKYGFQRLETALNTICASRVCTKNFEILLDMFKRITFLFSVHIRNRDIAFGVEKKQLWALFGAPMIRSLIFGSPQDLKQCKSKRDGQVVQASRTWQDCLTTNKPHVQICIGGSSPNTTGLIVERWPSGQPGVPLPHGCLQNSHCFEDGSVCNITTRVCSGAKTLSCHESSDCQGSYICREGLCIDSDAWNLTRFAGIDNQTAAEAKKFSLSSELLDVDYKLVNAWMGLYDGQAADFIIGHPVLQEIINGDTEMLNKYNYLRTGFDILGDQLLADKSFDPKVDTLDKLLASDFDADKFALKKERECSDKLFLLGLGQAKTQSQTTMFARAVNCAATLTYAKSSCYRNKKMFESWKLRTASALESGQDRMLQELADTVNKSLAKAGLELGSRTEFTKLVGRNFSAQLGAMSHNCTIPFDPIKVFFKLSPVMQLAKELTSGVLERLETMIKLALDFPTPDVSKTRMMLAPVALETVELLLHLSHGVIDDPMAALARHLEKSQSQEAVRKEFSYFIDFYNSSRTSINAECLKTAGISSSMSHEPQSILKACVALKLAEFSYTDAFDNLPFDHNCSQAVIKDAVPPRYVLDCRDTSEKLNTSVYAIKRITNFSQACKDPLYPYLYSAKGAGSQTAPKVFCSLKPAYAPQCKSDDDCGDLGNNVAGDSFGKSSCSSSLPLFFGIVDKYRGRCIYGTSPATPRNEIKFVNVPKVVEDSVTTSGTKLLHSTVPKIPQNTGDASGKQLDILVDVLRTILWPFAETGEWLITMVCFHGIQQKHNVTILGKPVSLDLPTRFDDFVGNDGLEKLFKLSANLIVVAMMLYPIILDPILSYMFAEAEAVAVSEGEALFEWVSAPKQGLREPPLGFTGEAKLGQRIEVASELDEGVSYGKEVLEVQREMRSGVKDTFGDVIERVIDYSVVDRTYLTSGGSRNPQVFESLNEYLESMFPKRKLSVMQENPTVYEMNKNLELLESKDWTMIGLDLDEDGAVRLFTDKKKFEDVLSTIHPSPVEITHTLDEIEGLGLERITVEYTQSQGKIFERGGALSRESFARGLEFPVDSLGIYVDLTFLRGFPNEVQMTLEVLVTSSENLEEYRMILLKVVFPLISL